MTAAHKPEQISVLLFDVGGVLVELGGVDAILGWLGHSITPEQLWHRWLHSESVRRFETGKIDAADFAAGIITEFALKIAPREFLDSFVGWPTGLYPGTLEMLARIPSRYSRALLSNSNALHWPRVLGEMQLGGAFEHHFVSHVTGHIKPDAGAFEHVLRSLGAEPAQVLFLDDNLLNIEAAQKLGLHAVRVRGIDEVRRALIELEILDGRG